MTHINEIPSLMVIQGGDWPLPGPAAGTSFFHITLCLMSTLSQPQLATSSCPPFSLLEKTAQCLPGTGRKATLA